MAEKSKVLSFNKSLIDVSALLARIILHFGGDVVFLFSQRAWGDARLEKLTMTTFEPFNQRKCNTSVP